MLTGPKTGGTLHAVSVGRRGAVGAGIAAVAPIFVLVLAGGAVAPAVAVAPSGAVGTAAPRTAEPRLTLVGGDLAMLLASWRAGNRDAGLRAAERLGSLGISDLLVTADRASVAAALWVAPHIDEPWTLAPTLLALVEGRDRRVALAACVALRAAVAASSGPPVGWAVEPEPEIEAAAERLASLAADRGAYPDVRISALAAAFALDAARNPDAPERRDLLALLIGDPDPELRRAAAELAPSDLPALAAALGDPDHRVVRAAGATVAAGAAGAGAEAGRLGALVPAATVWALDGALPPSDRAAALQILWAGGGEVERALVAAMVKDKVVPAALRETAKALMKKWKPGKAGK